MEEWKDIKGYEGIYQISNKGRVKSLHYGKEKILSGTPIKGGYLFINLSKNGKTKPFYIHRLVAQAFLPNPDNLPDVNHKDEDKTNNYVENLEWCSRKYNINYGNRNEITKKKNGKKILCVETQEIFDSSKDVICKMFNNKGTSANIRAHLRGRTKSCYGYHFKRIEE